MNKLIVGSGAALVLSPPMHSGAQDGIALFLLRVWQLFAGYAPRGPGNGAQMFDLSSVAGIRPATA